MQSRSRFVVVGILALAIIIAMPLRHGFDFVWVYFNWYDPAIFGRGFPLTALIAYLLVIGGAVFALRHQPTYAMANEVVDELAKVTWPSREETGSATIVVIIAVIISSLFLGVFDAVWLWLTDALLNAPGKIPGA